MKENLILVNYKVESEAYQALSELKRDTSNANYILSQAAFERCILPKAAFFRFH